MPKDEPIEGQAEDEPEAPAEAADATDAAAPAEQPADAAEGEQIEGTEEETEEEIVRVHPSAAVGETDDTLAAGREEHGKYFIGMWGPKPNFGCPYCSYSSIDSEGDVELHILSKIDSGDLPHRAALMLEGV